MGVAMGSVSFLCRERAWNRKAAAKRHSGRQANRIACEASFLSAPQERTTSGGLACAGDSVWPPCREKA
jgi:hypothetical protein